MTGQGRRGIYPTDYDMLLTFALSAANAAAGGSSFLQQLGAGH